MNNGMNQQQPSVPIPQLNQPAPIPPLSPFTYQDKYQLQGAMPIPQVRTVGPPDARIMINSQDPNAERIGGGEFTLGQLKGRLMSLTSDDPFTITSELETMTGKPAREFFNPDYRGLTQEAKFLIGQAKSEISKVIGEEQVNKEQYGFKKDNQGINFNQNMKERESNRHDFTAKTKQYDSIEAFKRMDRKDQLTAGTQALTSVDQRITKLDETIVELQSNGAKGDVINYYIGLRKQLVESRNKARTNLDRIAMGEDIFGNKDKEKPEDSKPKPYAKTKSGRDIYIENTNPASLRPPAKIVGTMQTGTTRDGRPIYTDTHDPSQPAVLKKEQVIRPFMGKPFTHSQWMEKHGLKTTNRY